MNSKDYNIIVGLLIAFAFVIVFVLVRMLHAPLHMSVYTEKDIYHIELEKKRIYTETGHYDIQFDTFEELAEWIENRTGTDIGS